MGRVSLMARAVGGWRWCGTVWCHSADGGLGTRMTPTQTLSTQAAAENQSGEAAKNQSGELYHFAYHFTIPLQNNQKTGQIPV